MIEPKSEVGSSSIVAQFVFGAPSWTSSTIDVGALAASRSSAAALTSVTMSVTSISAMPAGRDQLRQVLGHRTDEADLDRTEVLGPGRRAARGLSSPGSCARWRRGTPTRHHRTGLVVGVVRRHHPVDQVVVALVELVVAHRRDLETGLVERVDRRLVVLDERLERRGTDQVTRRSEHRVRVRRTQLLHRTRQHTRHRPTADAGSFDDPTVEVVGAEDLDVPRGRLDRRR